MDIIQIQLGMGLYSRFYMAEAARRELRVLITNCINITFSWKHKV